MVSPWLCNWYMNFSERGRNRISVKRSYSQVFLPSSDFWASVNHVYQLEASPQCSGILRSNSAFKSSVPWGHVWLLYSSSHASPKAEVQHFWEKLNLWDGLLSMPGTSSDNCPRFCHPHHVLHPAGSRLLASALDQECLSCHSANPRARKHPYGSLAWVERSAHRFLLRSLRSPD